MNIQQAVRRSRTQRGVGGILLIGGALFYFVSLLMALYRTAESMSHSLFLAQVGAKIQSFIFALYQITEPYIGFVWRNVPTLNQADPFNDGNLLFLGLIGVMIVGKQLMLSGRRLKARIQRQIDRVEEMQWHNSMMTGGATAGTQVSAGVIEQMNIYQQPMPPSPDGEWWTRPWGVLGLSIIGGYVVAVLAKLTGML
ncbi:YniB family protein [Pseudomonas sp. PB3P13]